MATIHFQNNPLNVQADPDVTKLNFRDLGEFDNESVTKPQTGKTGRVTITYKDATVPPRQFKVSQEVTFPDGAVVKISGGGAVTNQLRATDDRGDVGIWSLV